MEQKSLRALLQEVKWLGAICFECQRTFCLPKSVFHDHLKPGKRKKREVLLMGRIFCKLKFALSPSSEFHLVSLEVGLVPDNFNKAHPVEQNPDSAACHRAAEPAWLQRGVCGGGSFSFFSNFSQHGQFLKMFSSSALVKQYIKVMIHTTPFSLPSV